MKMKMDVLIWIDLLTNVLGMDNVTERLNFEKKVVLDGNTKTY
ncbi:MAG: hypothetical protein ACLTST_00050 [Lachnospiraceae bacterium]